MTEEDQDQFEYAVALSFASEDRGIAEEFGNLLLNKGISVLYDEYQVGAGRANELEGHLINIYSRKARYCVVFVSRHYPLQSWTEGERNSMQQLTLRDATEHILPIQLDNTEVPGIREAPGYRDLRQHSIKRIVKMVEGKLRERTVHPGPPPESHDLRSGNVPSSSRTSEVP